MKELMGMGLFGWLVSLVLGFIVGGLSLYIHLVRSGPPLDLWHTVDLKTEFDADRSDGVETFSDYLALEDRLLAGLSPELRESFLRTPLKMRARETERFVSERLLDEFGIREF